jgi:hypothetical protein
MAPTGFSEKILDRSRAVKKKFVILTVVVLVSMPAWANLRAPKKVDGFISGSMKTMLLHEAVILGREELKVVFPDLSPKLDLETASVSVAVCYELENAAPGPVTVPVKFLAVEIRSLAARLNGEAVPVELAADPAEKMECLARMARHRTLFMPKLYKGFISELRKRAGLSDVPDSEWLSGLEKADLAGLNFKDLYPWGLPSVKDDTDFQAAKLDLALQPGRNILEIVYRQRVFVDEKGYGYFSSWPAKGFTGVDYLLYPAASWRRAGDFRLAIRVEVPDYHHKVLFGTSWHRPHVRSDPTLKDAATDKKHLRVVEGNFTGVPADILTVLVWFDEKIFRYLSP